MTPEQFVYWLSGYMTSLDTSAREATEIKNEISNALKKVKTDQGGYYAMYYGENP